MAHNKTAYLKGTLGATFRPKLAGYVTMVLLMALRATAQPQASFASVLTPGNARNVGAIELDPVSLFYPARSLGFGYTMNRVRVTAKAFIEKPVRLDEAQRGETRMMRGVVLQAQFYPTGVAWGLFFAVHVAGTSVLTTDAGGATTLRPVAIDIAETIGYRINLPGSNEFYISVAGGTVIAVWRAPGGPTRTRIDRTRSLKVGFELVIGHEF